MNRLALAFRNVSRNRRRSLMAGGVVAMGAAAIAMTLGFMLATFFGLRESIVRADVGHIQIAMPGSYIAEANAALGLDPATQARIEKVLSAHPDVRFFLRRILFDGLATKGGSTTAIGGRGVDAEAEMRLSGIFAPVTSGRLMALEDDAREAMLGMRLGVRLGWEAGEPLTLQVRRADGKLNAFEVQGVGAYTTGVPDKDNHAVLVPLALAAEMLGTDHISRYVVVLGKTEQTDAVLADLRAALPDLDIRGWSVLDPFHNQVVTLYSNIFSVLCGIILLVVAMSVGGTMLMTVMERIREIGTLRAMGFSRGEISGGFLMEGALIGLMGALAGLAIAAGLSVAINLAGIEMPPAPGRTAAYPLILFVDPLVYAGVALGMVLCGVLGVILPALKGSRLSITTALGHT